MSATLGVDNKCAGHGKHRRRAANSAAGALICVELEDRAGFVALAVRKRGDAPPDQLTLRDCARSGSR